VRDVIQEDRPVGDPADKIEPEIAAMGSEVGPRRWMHLKELCRTEKQLIETNRMANVVVWIGRAE